MFDKDDRLHHSKRERILGFTLGLALASHFRAWYSKKNTKTKTCIAARYEESFDLRSDSHSFKTFAWYSISILASNS